MPPHGNVVKNMEEVYTEGIDQALHGKDRRIDANLGLIGGHKTGLECGHCRDEARTSKTLRLSARVESRYT